ncbi:MAG: hypothetical protein JF887_05210 [Candidatus Dormibacteraeota bacterium]|uniref:Uncharacterized protein n=1 Tax=Candidatus Amunia macphersoniae TaxID=3127014 RepID=A0A934NEI8_9BACT|nr:hypothetical protein [Candidatus Dormibacteraeota bacterium]
MKRRDSGLRDAFVGVLMTVGPFFGVRYQPPRVEIPVVTTPATEPDDDAPDYQKHRSASPEREHAHGAGDEGIIV